MVSSFYSIPFLLNVGLYKMCKNFKGEFSSILAPMCKAWQGQGGSSLGSVGLIAIWRWRLYLEEFQTFSLGSSFLAQFHLKGLYSLLKVYGLIWYKLLQLMRWFLYNFIGKKWGNCLDYLSRPKQKQIGRLVDKLLR